MKHTSIYVAFKTLKLRIIRFNFAAVDFNSMKWYWSLRRLPYRKKLFSEVHLDSCFLLPSFIPSLRYELSDTNWHECSSVSGCVSVKWACVGGGEIWRALSGQGGFIVWQAMHLALSSAFTGACIAHLTGTTAAPLMQNFNNCYLVHPTFRYSVIVISIPVRREGGDTFLSNFTTSYLTWPPLWYGGQSSWLLTQRSWVQFPALPDFLSSNRSGTGSTQLLWE
jgi:hypothetical protein